MLRDLHLPDAEVQLVAHESHGIHQLKKAESGDKRLLLATAHAMAIQKTEAGLSNGYRTMGPHCSVERRLDH